MAKYDLASAYDWKRFVMRANRLHKMKALVELADHSKKTVNQNNYLHLAIGIFAMETGESFSRVKQVYFKMFCCGDIFIHRVYDKILDKEIEDVRSTRDLSKEEMSICIDRWIKWCAEKGIIIPSPEDDESLKQAAIMVDNVKRFM